jgi:hypothetical protein
MHPEILKLFDFIIIKIPFKISLCSKIVSTNRNKEETVGTEC